MSMLEELLDRFGEAEGSVSADDCGAQDTCTQELCDGDQQTGKI